MNWQLSHIELYSISVGWDNLHTFIQAEFDFTLFFSIKKSSFAGYEKVF